MSNYIPATPYARMLARERGVDLSQATPTGPGGEVRARDVLNVQGAAETKATPLAARMARDMGLNIAGMNGTGHGGKVTKLDVLAKAGGGVKVEAAKTVAGRRKKLSGMRKVVGKRMVQAHNEIPPVTQTMLVNVTDLLESRRKLNAVTSRKYSINDFVLKAVAKALRAFPNILVSLDGDEVVYHEHINLGMAVAVDDGLVVPVINDADKLSIDELSDTARDLAARARGNKLAPDEYRGNTFTVTNMGMFDIETFTPIINQPDAAILGVCSVEDQIILNEGVLSVRKVMRTCVTFDHRLLDGATTAKFQQEVKRLLENPMEIVM